MPATSDASYRFNRAFRTTAAIAISIALAAGEAFAGRPTSRVLIAGGQTRDSNGFFVATDTSEIYDSASGTFTPSANTMVTAREFHTATLVNVPNNLGTTNPEVLLAGGADSSTNTLASAELYDPATDSFSAIGQPMNQAREYQTASPLPNGEVLIAGGEAYDSSTSSYVALDTAEIYDPAAGTFTMVTCGSGSYDCMSSPRSGATATVLSNGEVLIAGGYTNSGVSNTADLFDPNTNSFVPVSNPMTHSRELASAALLTDGTVLIGGGNDGLGVVVGSAEIYDPTTDSFAPAYSSMIVGRSQGTATLLNNGNVLFAGGSFDPTFGTETDIYQQRTGTFTSGGTLSADRYAQTATLLSNGSVLIAGGYSFAGSPQNTADLANARGTRISATGSMSMARAGHTATLLP